MNITDKFYINLGKWLKYAREKSDCTQREAAKALGVSYQCYQKYENGTVKMPFDSAVKICRFHKRSFDRMIYACLTGEIW